MQNTTTSISYLHNNSNLKSSMVIPIYNEATNQVFGLEWMLMHNAHAAALTPSHISIWRMTQIWKGKLSTSTS